MLMISSEGFSVRGNTKLEVSTNPLLEDELDRQTHLRPMAYHLWIVESPAGAFQRFVPGEYEMTLVANGKRRAVEFDAAASTYGWNEVGEFDLEAGAVSIEVSNKTTGNVVFADAIRWQPLGHGPR